MFLRTKLAAFCAICVSLLIQELSWSQESQPASLSEPQSPSLSEPQSRTAAVEEIPFSVLQQIMSGSTINGEIRADLSSEQIDAMKKAEQAMPAETSDFYSVSSVISQAGLECRRFTAALESIKSERESQLRDEWLKIITPEQQASIRRRNRKMILQASLSKRSPDQALLNDTVSLDQLMAKNDLLSVVERPGVQDLLDLSDDQLNRIEELQIAAEADAVAAIRRTAEAVRDSKNSPQPASKPSPALAELHSRTMEILSPVQVAQFTKLTTSPARMQKLMQNPDAVVSGEIFRAMQPHGVPTSLSTTVVNGKANAAAELNNAFIAPDIQQALQLTEEQHKKIAEVLEKHREVVVAEMAARAQAYSNQQRKLAQETTKALQAHVEMFRAQALIILSPGQMETLERERLRGLGFWALQKPNVRSSLQLTPEQISGIEPVLARQPPQLDFKPPTPGGNFQKEAEEFHQRARKHGQLMSEHHQQQSKDIEKLLTDSQRNKFTEMTGYRFLSGPSI